MEFVIGQKVNHKVFGTGVVVNVIDKPSGSASHEQYVDVEFDVAKLKTGINAAMYPSDIEALTNDKLVRYPLTLGYSS